MLFQITSPGLYILLLVFFNNILIFFVLLGPKLTPHLSDVTYLSDLLQPVPPSVSLRESVQVYKEHCRMAREFHQVKHEMAVLEDRK